MKSNMAIPSLDSRRFSADTVLSNPYSARRHSASRVHPVHQLDSTSEQIEVSTRGTDLCKCYVNLPPNLLTLCVASSLVPEEASGLSSIQGVGEFFVGNLLQTVIGGYTLKYMIEDLPLNDGLCGVPGLPLALVVFVISFGFFAGFTFHLSFQVAYGADTVIDSQSGKRMAVRKTSSAMRFFLCLLAVIEFLKHALIIAAGTFVLFYSTSLGNLVTNAVTVAFVGSFDFGVLATVDSELNDLSRFEFGMFPCPKPPKGAWMRRFKKNILWIWLVSCFVIVHIARSRFGESGCSKWF